MVPIVPPLFLFFFGDCIPTTNVIDEKVRVSSDYSPCWWINTPSSSPLLSTSSFNPHVSLGEKPTHRGQALLSVLLMRCWCLFRWVAAMMLFWVVLSES